MGKPKGLKQIPNGVRIQFGYSTIKEKETPTSKEEAKPGVLNKIKNFFSSKKQSE